MLSSELFKEDLMNVCLDMHAVLIRDVHMHVCARMLGCVDTAYFSF